MASGHLPLGATSRWARSARVSRFPLHVALAVFDLEFQQGVAPVDAARCQQTGTLADTNPACPGLGVAAFDANECGRREDVGKILHRVPAGSLGRKCRQVRESMSASIRVVGATRRIGSGRVRSSERVQPPCRSHLGSTRLYAETSTPTAEIRERFSIGESSLYRVVQRHGVALRGRTGHSTRSKPPRTAVSARPRRSSSPSGGGPSDSRSPATAGTAALRTSSRTRGKSTRGPAQRAIATPGTVALVGTASSRTSGAARLRFRIRFEAERVLEANDIRDALRQAESLGTVEITSVAREDQ